MPLREVQRFLATYVRDQDVRAQYRNGATSEIEQRLGLSEADVALIRQINLPELEYLAEHVLMERLGRTNGVFGMLLEHLARYVDVNACYRQYDHAWPGGWWQRRAEIRRFEAFATDLITREGLPEYLIDVCRFGAHITLIAETPKVHPGARHDLPGLQKLFGNMTLSLRQPYEVLRFRYDPIRMLDEPEHYGMAPTPRVTDVLVQRDWRQHKRSRVFRLGDHPILHALAAGPSTVFELGAHLPEFSYATILDAGAELYVNQIVHLAVPPELAGDFASALPRIASHNGEEGRDGAL